VAVYYDDPEGESRFMVRRREKKEKKRKGGEILPFSV
jgi:hypothetical protein